MTREELLSMAFAAGFSVRGETIRTIHSSGAWVGINDKLMRFAELATEKERAARQEAQLRIEELQAQLVRADAERCMAVSNAMRRMQAGEKLTYTDKEVELIMLGWQAEFDKAKAARIEAQTENEALKAKLAKSGLEKWRAVREAVAAEREACAALCETLQAPDSCTGVERSLWDVATMACADAIRARGSQ
jgi:hypothetical protein